jgi:F-type H+-transporting ATPase subunit epsilon
MADQIKLEIVTPERTTYSEDVDMVTLPGVEGDIGVYPNHVPLMTQVKAGEVVVRREGQEQFLAVGEGFAKITGNHLAILTDMAVRADEIDESAAEEARKKAEARLNDEKLTDEEIAAEAAVMAHAVAQLDVIRRRGRKSV